MPNCYAAEASGPTSKDNIPAHARQAEQTLPHEAEGVRYMFSGNAQAMISSLSAEK